MELSNEEKAYLAAIIDGEGSIIISKRPPNVNRGEINTSYYNNLHITNNDGRLISWISEKLGIGSISCDPPRRNNKYHHRWSCASNEAVNLLRDVYSFLVIKKEQADIVFEFRKTFIGVIPKFGLSSDVLNARESCYLRLKHLHHNAPV